MQITEKAKNIFLAAMEKTGKEVAHIGLVTHSCGGKGLDLRLIVKEEATRLMEIDGVLCDIPEDAEAFLEGFVFDAEGQNLRLIAPERSHCGCDDCDDCHDGCCHH